MRTVICLTLRHINLCACAAPAASTSSRHLALLLPRAVYALARALTEYLLISNAIGKSINQAPNCKRARTTERARVFFFGLCNSSFNENAPARCSVAQSALISACAFAHYYSFRTRAQARELCKWNGVHGVDRALCAMIRPWQRSA